jgi:hypothetical protein
MSGLRALGAWLSRYWAILTFMLTLTASAFAWALGVDRQIERNADAVEECQEDIEDVAACMERISETQARLANDGARAEVERAALDNRLEYQTWLMQELYRQVTGSRPPESVPE